MAYPPPLINITLSSLSGKPLQHTTGRIFLCSTQAVPTTHYYPPSGGCGRAGLPPPHPTQAKGVARGQRRRANCCRHSFLQRQANGAHGCQTTGVICMYMSIYISDIHLVLPALWVQFSHLPLLRHIIPPTDGRAYWLFHCNAMDVALLYGGPYAALPFTQRLPPLLATTLPTYNTRLLHSPPWTCQFSACFY